MCLQPNQIIFSWRIKEKEQPCNHTASKSFESISILNWICGDHGIVS